ncbi:MAG: hypothetical protein JSS02_03290, partial [Planctomycetes bacterium]|nr:hypothetical protein [Planctomycetota bacterium]
MGQPTTLLQRFLAPHATTFWQWRGDGSVMAWRDGQTIAFRAEVDAVLQRLVPYGWPHLDAIALFLAACRGVRHAKGSEYLTQELLPHGSDQWQHSPLLNDLKAVLDEITALSSELRSSTARKADLAEQVFETADPMIPSETARALLNEMQRGIHPDLLEPQSPAHPPVLLSRLQALAAGAGRITADRLQLRRETGLEQLPESAQATEERPATFADLLRRLEQDDELAGLVRLTRQLMAALTLPRALLDQEDLPLGGVSDITNRGSFDRLLLSELAHDDATFIVRVALNEALYLRRESPPQEPPRKRVVFIDAGIRLWGVPRVFATAVALALAGTRRRGDELAAYRPRRAHLDHVDLLTPAGIREHLGVRESSLHPGAAIPTLARLLQGDAEPGADRRGKPADETAEIVLITAAEVLADADFQRALAGWDSLLYLVSVERSGRMELIRRSPRGRKTLRETRYDLEQILAPRPRITTLVDPTIDSRLPALLRLRKFPLLLPVAPDPQRIWKAAGDKALAVMADQRLLYWTDSRFAARQISDSIPPGKLYWSDLGQDLQTSCAVVGRLSATGLFLLKVDLSSLTCQVRPLVLANPNPLGVCMHAGALLVIGTHSVEVFSLEDAQPLGTLARPHPLTWQRDRFFCEGVPEARTQRWYALARTGTGAVFELVGEFPRPEHPDSLLMLFDVSALDGPVGVTSKGELRHFPPRDPDRTGSPRLNPGVVMSSKAPPSHFQFGAVSRDGRQLVLTSPTWMNSGRASHWLFDQQTDSVQQVETSDPQALLLEPLLQLAKVRTDVHSRFKGVVFQGGVLAVVLNGNNAMWALLATAGEHKPRSYGWRKIAVGSLAALRA